MCVCVCVCVSAFQCVCGGAGGERVEGIYREGERRARKDRERGRELEEASG